MAWKNHLDKIGIVGSFIATACCLGLPAILSIVAAFGLGFIIKDAVLLPLMVVFLTITLIGLFFGYRAHRKPWALVVGIASSIAVLFFVFAQTIQLAAYLAIGGLVFSSILNVLLRRKSWAI